MSKAGFVLYSPISILAVPVTVLVINPGASLPVLMAMGVLLTVVMFLIYLPFTWMDRRIEQKASVAKFINFISAVITIGAIRGYLFFQIVESLDLKAPGDLLNRVFASTATTFFWLSTANILINLSRNFRIRYQESLDKFIKQNIGAISLLAPSSQSLNEVDRMQEEFMKSFSSRLVDEGAENLREVAELLKSKINYELRPLSRRIWLRSLTELPVVRFPQLLRDSVKFLEFSRPLFIGIMTFLALLDNVFIRSLSESIIRTAIFLALLLAIILLAKRKVLRDNRLYLIAVGLVPVLGSEFLSANLGFNGSWTATLLISTVAPAVMIVLSLFNLALRDHSLLIELLENFDITKKANSSKPVDVGERHLASYLHNSLQSELLAIAGQLEDAATANNRNKSSAILQKVNSLINRSFIDDFEKFSESPLDRLQVVRESWSGILNIAIEIPQELLTSPDRNAALVQTIEEFIGNSFRHGKATEISVLGESSALGLRLILKSNGRRKLSAKRGLGTEWLDQISLGPWSLESTNAGTKLEVTI